MKTTDTVRQIKDNEVDPALLEARAALKALGKPKEPWFEVLGGDATRDCVADVCAPILAWHLCGHTRALAEYLDDHVTAQAMLAGAVRLTYGNRAIVFATGTFWNPHATPTPHALKMAVGGRNVMFFPQRAFKAVLDVEAAAGVSLRPEGDGTEFVSGWAGCLEDAPVIGADPRALFRSRYARLIAGEKEAAQVAGALGVARWGDVTLRFNADFSQAVVLCDGRETGRVATRQSLKLGQKPWSVLEGLARYNGNLREMRGDASGGLPQHVKQDLSRLNTGLRNLVGLESRPIENGKAGFRIECEADDMREDELARLIRDGKRLEAEEGGTIER